MICFQNELQGDVVQTDEGAETKDMDKKGIYDILAHKFYLPPYHSKGVTREYLLSVFRG